MVVQKAIKSYPMVKWFLVGSGVLVVLGLVMSKVLSEPDEADSTTLLMFLGAAVVLPFLAMLFPRRRVVEMELPTDQLSGMSKAELEGVLSQLDAAKAKGEMDDVRYAKARERILASIRAKKKT
jgi:uncharacterized membrane protein YgaE (UPF0421/DUF939 family)